MFLDRPLTLNRRKEREKTPDTADLLALVDENDRPILCFACNKSSLPTETNPVERPILTCVECAARWHIDCVDPPLTHVPAAVIKRWRCPLHAEADIEQSALLYPAHRNRRVRGAPALTPIYSRGMKNNGLIEIEDDLADYPGSDSRAAKRRRVDGGPAVVPELGAGTAGIQLDPSETLATTYPDPDSYGRVHKLSASKIALDMIEK